MPFCEAEKLWIRMDRDRCEAAHSSTEPAAELELEAVGPSQGRSRDVAKRIRLKSMAVSFRHFHADRGAYVR